MGKYHKRKSAAGKGDRPLNNWSPQFRSNYDSIDWSKPAKIRPEAAKPQQSAVATNPAN